jgi:hypothetical protein
MLALNAFDVDAILGKKSARFARVVSKSRELSEVQTFSMVVIQ